MDTVQKKLLLGRQLTTRRVEMFLRNRKPHRGIDVTAEVGTDNVIVPHSSTRFPAVPRPTVLMIERPRGRGTAAVLQWHGTSEVVHHEHGIRAKSFHGAQFHFSVYDIDAARMAAKLEVVFVGAFKNAPFMEKITSLFGLYPDQIVAALMGKKNDTPFLKFVRIDEMPLDRDFGIVVPRQFLDEDRLGIRATA